MKGYWRPPSAGLLWDKLIGHGSLLALLTKKSFLLNSFTKQQG